MTQQAPSLVVIGGPNGAGKSTTAPRLLVGALRVTEFVNADLIAQGLSGFHPDRAAIEAGRVMLRRLHELAKQRADFAFETTMASRTFVPWLARLRGQGYAVHLVFLWLPTVEMAIARVAERVRVGGHAVPEDTIRRRFRTGLRNFLELYRPMAASWRLYDNAELSRPRLIVSQTNNGDVIISDPITWTSIQGDARHE
jgi:predicted ABC-type ATPase